MLKSLYKYHKKIGLIIALPLVLWCLSGMMHPFMSSWLKPQRAHRMFTVPTVEVSSDAISLEKVLSLREIEEVKNVRAIHFEGQNYWQITLPKALERRYFNTISGKEWMNGDQEYAVFLARYFTGEQTAKVQEAVVINEFSVDYKYVNRFLPAWKVILSFFNIFHKTVFSKRTSYS